MEKLKKNRKTRYIFLALLIIWMISVFCFSHQTSDISSGTSGNTIRVIINIIPGVKDLQETEKQELVEILQPIARKLAHFTIYTIGGILSILFVNTFNNTDKFKILYASLICIIYSISDEIHQYFVPGRSGELRDIMIDSLGVILGVLIGLLFIKIIERRKING